MTATVGRIIRFRCAQRNAAASLCSFSFSLPRAVSFLQSAAMKERWTMQQQQHAGPPVFCGGVFLTYLPIFFLYQNFSQQRGNRFGSSQNITPPIQLCARAFAAERDIAFWHGIAP
jgi:hypothetical protein